jgi:hypothetical protein
VRVLYVLSALNLADGAFTALWIRFLPHLEVNPVFRSLVQTYGVTGSFLLKAALSVLLVLRATSGRQVPPWELAALRTLAWIYGLAVLQQIPLVLRLLQKSVL